MSQIHKCPECGKGLKIPDSKRGAVVRCPACKSKFRVPELDSPQERRRSKVAGQRKASRPASDDPYAVPTIKKRSTRCRKRTADGQVNPKDFAKKLLVPHGIVLSISALLIVGGFFSEYSALAASGLLIIAVLTCILAGRIWMAVDIGKTSVGMGIAALLVPLVGLVISFRDKGPSLRGALTLVSSFMYVLPLGLVLLLFAPNSSGRAAFGPRAPSKAMSPETWAERVETYQETLTDNSPVITFSGTAMGRAPGAIEDLATRGDSLLSRFQGYVKGSFSVDTTQRTVTFQFRGKEQHKTAYGFYVGLSTNNHVRSK